MITPPSNSILFFILLLLFSTVKNASGGGGSWQMLQKNIGIVSMHMQLLHNDRVIIFDRTDFGPSNLSLPDGKCRNNTNDLALQLDCTAHSVEYNVLANTFRSLMVQTDVWCSSGAATPDGRLIQTGGFNDGDHVVRIFDPCDQCDWQEIPNGLINRRWYATNHILPDGRQIILGGRRQFNYEFYPKTPVSKNVYSLPFLVQTNDFNQENNLYPFLFLNVDGNLFIFANNRAILFDYLKNNIVKTYPTMPGGDPRNYPSSGSAVLLPIKNFQTAEAEVLVCGGAPKGSFSKAVNGTFVGALNTCGRIKITDPAPQWVMETMPLSRVMGDMILLPDGNVLIINGAASGTAGWENGRDPVLQPVLYRPGNPIRSRFEVQNPSTILRMYHSTAVLIRDGRVLVGGSNPHIFYNFSNVLYPTELSLEAFSPSYLESQYTNVRPKIVVTGTAEVKIGYGKLITVQFMVTNVSASIPNVTVTMVLPSFNTHSFSMNQRLVVLGNGKVSNLGKSTFGVEVMTPVSGFVAPPGYYLLFVVNQDIPSEGIWVQLQ